MAGLRMLSSRLAFGFGWEDFILFLWFDVQHPTDQTFSEQFLLHELLGNYLLYCASVKIRSPVNKPCYELTGTASVSEWVKELPTVIKPVLSLSGSEWGVDSQRRASSINPFSCSSFSRCEK